MNIKNKRLIGLLLLSVVQIIFPLIFIAAKEKVIQDGKEYQFEIQPVDPYDFFQGKYVHLNVKPLTIASSKLKGYKKNDMIYVELKSDSLGTSIESVSKNKSENSLKLKLTSDPKKHRVIALKLPFNRFYLEEYNANKVEMKLAVSSSKTNYVHVKILNGDFVITDISSNGKSLVDGKALFQP